MPNTHVLQGIKPEAVWNFFEQISTIPRCSKHEEQIRAYLFDFARRHSLDASEDAIGNIVIRKGGTNGSSVPLILQAHVDMVCEKHSTITKDMQKEALDLCVDGMWLHAEGTTLGADNGVGLAMILAILDGDYLHPPIEALFTTDEESALVGACALDPSLVKARRLINIDSDRQDYFCIGAAGGQTVLGICPAEWEASPPNAKCFQLSVEGLKGGHSGVMIHEGRGNSVKLLFRLLSRLPTSLQLYALDAGGPRHNAIPREACASFSLPMAQEAEINSCMEIMREEFALEFSELEADLALSCQQVEASSQVLSAAASQILIRTVLTIPDGPLSMSRQLSGIVESSSNLAGAWLKQDGLHILTSQRALFEHLIDYASLVVSSAIVQGGGRTIFSERFPCWPPLQSSALQSFLTKVFRELRGKDAEIEVVHAGLECGAIRQRVGELDAISMGVCIEEAHSPHERVHIKSVEETWDFLIEALRLMK